MRTKHLLIMMTLSIFLMAATKVDPFKCAHSASGGGGDPGPVVPPPHGAFSYEASRRSSIQLNAEPDETYHGRLQITISQKIDEITAHLAGYEICAGDRETDWYEDYSFTNFDGFHVLRGGGFTSDPRDCGAILVAHPLEWHYGYTLENTGAPIVLRTEFDTCDVKGGLCADYYGDP